MRVAVIDYGSGNLHSVLRAVERASRESGGGGEIILTSDPGEVARSDRIVLPGVGAFADCRRGLEALSGMDDVINDHVTRRARPFLGICVGMQMMATRGLEKTITDGFGWIDGDVVEIKPNDETLKIPQIGWNTLDQVRPHPLLAGIATGPEGLHAYFVHSYHLQATDPADVIATTDYGGKVTAMVARGPCAGTQFHPEKSQALGLALIANFLRWLP